MRQVLPITPLTVNTHQGEPPPQSLDLMQLQLCMDSNSSETWWTGAGTPVTLHTGVVAVAGCWTPTNKQQEQLNK